MRYILFCLLCVGLSTAQAQLTKFEISKGKQSATYFEAVDFYKKLAASSNKVTIKDIGTTDAGYPLQLVMVSNNGDHNPTNWHKDNKLVVMIQNGIHPGEPDGIDASLMLVRDIVTNKLILPNNVCLAIIPVYNIGGSINRGAYSRANQNGPEEYGFRGNAQNLDLNRDYTKADSRNAQSFAKAFHYLNPEILIDNHVSDGADFQHVFTLLTTQYNKLGQPLGDYLFQTFEPELYKTMKTKGWDLFPYVNFNAYDLKRGMTQFYDSPRYSSGYAALFSTIGFVPETHMLKPYYQRVKSTYDFMATIISTGSAKASEIIENRKKTIEAINNAKQLPLAFKVDGSKSDNITFLGYERDTIMSKATGLPAMHYNKNKPFSAPVGFKHFFNPVQIVDIPTYYIVPQGWHQAIQRLQENNVQMHRITIDSTIKVNAYKINDYKSMTKPYESHFKLSQVQVTDTNITVTLRKGDYLISTNQKARRYLVEMLEPTGDDSFFSWNYFDAILQQKEGYSDYRWEDVAADWLDKNPNLRTALEAKKQADPAFAKNSSAILNWIYINSPYYEPAHNRYPIFRIMSNK